jgi:hypothetical protein
MAGAASHNEAMSDSWQIVDVVKDILDPATERLFGSEIAGREVVDELAERDRFGNRRDRDAGRLAP